MRPPNPPPPIAAAATVPEVIQALGGFVAWCEANSCRLGYFAALYMRITKAVEAALAQGTVFQDNERMAQLDATFANRYFMALNAYLHPESSPCASACWLASFEGTETAGGSVTQYMLTGVAAHIGLDLGIATQQVCGAPATLQRFQGDFDQINTVLAEQVQTVLAEIDTVSPLLADLYVVLGKHEIALIDDGLGGQRAASWAFANALAAQQPSQQAPTIAAQDALVAELIPILSSPPEPLGAVAQIIAQHENTNIAQVIAGLLP